MLWRLAVHNADPQFLFNHAYFRTVAENVLGHAFRQRDEAMIVADVRLSDVTPLRARLVASRPNDVAGLHAVSMTDFQPEGFKHNIVGVATPAARCPCTAGVSRATLAARVGTTR